MLNIVTNILLSPKNNINNMLIVLLNTEGQYCVGELKGSRFYIIEPWTSKTFINKGYDIKTERYYRNERYYKVYF